MAKGAFNLGGDPPNSVKYFSRSRVIEFSLSREHSATRALPQPARANKSFASTSQNLAFNKCRKRKRVVEIEGMLCGLIHTLLAGKENQD